MILLAVLTLLLLVSAPSGAVDLCDNFGGSYSATGGNYLVGPTSPNPPILPPVQWATAFEADPAAGEGPWRLTSIEMPVLWQTYGSDSLEVHLHLDGSGIPGERVASATIPDVSSAETLVREAVFIEGPAILPGATYWVVVNSVEDGEHTWQYVEPRIRNEEMLYWVFNDGGPWVVSSGSTSAFRVNGAPDPSIDVPMTSVSGLKSRFD
jgi:hypothetical protein